MAIEKSHKMTYLLKGVYVLGPRRSFALIHTYVDVDHLLFNISFKKP